MSDVRHERCLAEIIGWERITWKDSGDTVRWQPEGVAWSDGSPPNSDDLRTWLRNNDRLVALVDIGPVEAITVEIRHPATHGRSGWFEVVRGTSLRTTLEEAVFACDRWDREEN